MTNARNIYIRPDLLTKHSEWVQESELGQRCSPQTHCKNCHWSGECLHCGTFDGRDADEDLFADAPCDGCSEYTKCQRSLVFNMRKWLCDECQDILLTYVGERPYLKEKFYVEYQERQRRWTEKWDAGNRIIDEAMEDWRKQEEVRIAQVIEERCDEVRYEFPLNEVVKWL